MSAIDETIEAIAAVIEKMAEVSASIEASRSQADDALNMAMALGAAAAVEGMHQVKNDLESLASNFQGIVAEATEVLSTAKAVADST